VTSAERIRALAEAASGEELAEVAGALANALASVLARSGRVAVAPAKDATSSGLLTVAAASKRLGVAPSWLYRHAGKLPFTRKLSHKALRFDARGLERWAASRQAGQ
jgi:predicted DNA-binding transcriptional regulator AlpA